MMERSTTVLLVDDNEVDNFIHTQLLQTLGVKQIHTADDGKQAFHWLFRPNGPDPEACRLGEVDLILLDINMPDVDGFQFLDLMQERGYGESIPQKVVILTSSLNDADRRTAETYPVKGFLRKPLTLEAAATLFN